MCRRPLAQATATDRGWDPARKRWVVREVIRSGCAALTLNDPPRSTRPPRVKAKPLRGQLRCALTRGTRAGALPPSRRLSRWSSRPGRGGSRTWERAPTEQSGCRCSRAKVDGSGFGARSRLPGHQLTERGGPLRCIAGGPSVAGGAASPQGVPASALRTWRGVVGGADRRPLTRERGPRTLGRHRSRRVRMLPLSAAP